MECGPKVGACGSSQSQQEWATGRFLLHQPVPGKNFYTKELEDPDSGYSIPRMSKQGLRQLSCLWALVPLSLKGEVKCVHLRIWGRASEEMIHLAPSLPGIFCKDHDKEGCKGKKDTSSSTKNFYRETGCGDTEDFSLYIFIVP